MCGIAGIIRIHDPKNGDPPAHLDAIPEAWLDTLDDSIKHRGPDGAGRFRDRSVRDDCIVVDVALVHRRLSIIDHEGGHQPMVHDGERLRQDLTYGPGETPILAHEVEPEKPLVAVVFNGCIYNHHELQKELEAKGHVFETDHSDTEVLVHGWKEYGYELGTHLDGMFATLTWQRESSTFSWARDPAGEKPLFKSSDQWHGYFASSARGLIELQCTNDPRLCTYPEIVKDYWRLSVHNLAYGRLQSVPQGTAFKHPMDDPLPYFEPHSHWNDPLGAVSQLRGTNRYNTEATGFGFHLIREESMTQKTAPEFASLIESATTSRLEADAPLGVFLSGGIDSGLISAIARQHRPDIKTFTVRMPDVGLDESEAAQETAHHLGTDHHTLDCDPNPAEDLVHLIHQLGLPFGDSSLLPTYWVSKAAREHVKVALSGDGADELFGGYKRHTIARSLHRWSLLLMFIPNGLLDRRKPGSRSEYLARLAVAARHNLGYPELINAFQLPDLSKLIHRFSRELVGAPIAEWAIDPLDYDFHTYLPQDLLRKTDTASMAVALEVRAPFLARELVEAALRTPIDVLMPGGERKGLLKQVARKYIPDHIVDRPKQGFAIPIGEWFRTDYGSMRTLLYDHLESSDPFPGLAEAGVNINMDFVRRMLREHDAAGEKSINPWHGRDHSQRLYMLLVLSIWSKWLQSIR